jgi:hypothetical protein
MLFPFILKIGPTQQSAYVTARVLPGSLGALIGLGVCTLLFAAGTKIITGTWPRTLPIITVVMTGLYGLVAMITAKACD